MSSLTQHRLKELIHYCPDTGAFTWRVTVGSRAVAGQRAGTGAPGCRGQIRVDGKIYRYHRLAVLYVTGKWPPHQVDHIDGDPSNNRWDNLRLATNSQNAKAFKKLSHKNKSGVRGVSWCRYRRRWYASIRYADKKVDLKCDGTLFGAVAARKSFECRVKYGEF